MTAPRSDRVGLVNVPCLRRVDPTTLAVLRTRLAGRAVRRGAVLARQGGAFDRILIVTEGRLKVAFRTGAGKDRTLRILGRSDCLCFAPAHLSVASPVSIEALTDARVCWLARQDLNGLALSAPDFTRDVMSCVMGRMNEAIHEVGTDARRPVKARVLRTLLDLARRQGVRDGPSVRIDGLTHEELAACVGASREVVSRALGLLQREGVLRTGRGKIHLRDMTTLEEAIRSDRAVE